MKIRCMIWVKFNTYRGIVVEIVSHANNILSFLFVGKYKRETHCNVRNARVSGHFTNHKFCQLINYRLRLYISDCLHYWQNFFVRFLLHN